MGYKSKKINKRRYFKSLQKRQSRKLMKKGMYGGDEESSLSVNNEQVQPEKISKEEEVPTVVDNIKDVGNLGVSLMTNVAADSIQTAAEYTGLDPNASINENVEKTSDKIKDIVEVLNSPEGEKLKEEAGELLADGVEVLKPSLEKGQEILMDGAKKLAETGTGIVITAANELPPIFLINEMSKFGTAAVQAGETLAELTTTGAEAVESLQDQKKKAESLWGKAKNLFSNVSEGINTSVSGVIKTAQKSVDDYGKNIVKEGTKNFPEIPSRPEIPSNIKMSSPIELEGGSLKKYKKEKMMIGGRITQSQLEFLGGKQNSSQNLQQYGGKWKTKRRHSLKRKMTSRRR